MKGKARAKGSKIKKRGKHNVTRTCNGKVRYRDEMEAKAAVMSLSSSTRQNNVQRWYDCPRCEGYHLTSARTDPRDFDPRY